jgi:hypothetical protein
MSWLREMALREAVNRLIGLFGSSSSVRTSLGSAVSAADAESLIGDAMGGSPWSSMSFVGGGLGEGDLLRVCVPATGLWAAAVGSEIRTGTKVGMEWNDGMERTLGGEWRSDTDPVVPSTQFAALTLSRPLFARGERTEFGLENGEAEV